MMFFFKIFLIFNYMYVSVYAYMHVSAVPEEARGHWIPSAAKVTGGSEPPDGGSGN